MRCLQDILPSSLTSPFRFTKRSSQEKLVILHSSLQFSGSNIHVQYLSATRYKQMRYTLYLMSTVLAADVYIMML